MGLLAFRSRLICAAILALMLVAQLPNALNVCFSTAGIRVGYGCQCPQCSAASIDPQCRDDIDAQQGDCSCSNPHCADGSRDGNAMNAAPCCDDLKLPYHLVAVRLPAPQTCSEQPCLYPALLEPRQYLAQPGPALRIAELEQPPGGTSLLLLEHTILLI